jgi:predicted HTH transcriptional regulator
VVEQNKDLYYKALRRTQGTLKQDKPDWEPWLRFFLRCLKKQKDNLVAKVELEKEERSQKAELPLLSVLILQLLKKNERMTISEIEAATGANRNTLKVRLRELVDTEYILQRGKARATWYSLKNLC